MPVMKKKGAIFPIYADTPPRAGPAPREEPAQPRDGRRALANIEPAPVRRKTSASPSSKRRALAPRSPTRSTRTKMDVFVDPDAQMERPKRSALASKPLMSKPLSKSPSGKPLASKPLASKSQSQSQSQSLNARASSSSLSKPPVKRRTRTPMDKENAVLPDSPASRTRSKLRLADEPKSKPKTARAFTVFADPLADVSEAYGATGEEPEGFREQGTSRKAIRS
ncbi:hypothetical protein CspHIS471_0507010 [Cutaneotrichosporon sp. HIS471]|nr:hypothetical protein CspHIS471_0507010 [Cutaneotrichosporon sp. HIS471]